MNSFAFDTSDFQFLLNTVGETVTIDNIKQKAIVNNAKIGDYEDKYIHTLEPIRHGNLIVYNGENYLIISETVTQRYGKYKALMRHCNYTIQIQITEQRITGYNPWGEPIYETIVVGEIFIPAIIDKYAFKVDDPAPIRVSDKQIIVTIQNNETNKNKFTVNTTFEVMGQTWKVIDVDKTRTGLLILTCELGNQI